jgi:hypothetical protein
MHEAARTGTNKGSVKAARSLVTLEAKRRLLPISQEDLEKDQLS